MIGEFTNPLIPSFAPFIHSFTPSTHSLHSTVLSVIAATIRRRALFAADDAVAVALSGGADSVALAWILHELAAQSTWTCAGLIHVNHGLRGEASDADEAFSASAA